MTAIALSTWQCLNVVVGWVGTCLTYLSLFNKEDFLSQKLFNRFHLKSYWSEIDHTAILGLRGGIARFPESTGRLQLGGKKGQSSRWTGNSTRPKCKLKNEKIGLEGTRVDVGRPLRRPVAKGIVQERQDEMMGTWTKGISRSRAGWILGIF